MAYCLKLIEDRTAPFGFFALFESFRRQNCFICIVWKLLKTELVGEARHNADRHSCFHHNQLIIMVTIWLLVVFLVVLAEISAERRTLSLACTCLWTAFVKNVQQMALLFLMIQFCQWQKYTIGGTSVLIDTILSFLVWTY